MNSKRRLLALLAATAAFLSLTPAQAALQARDYNNDGTIDGLYDADLNVTWLSNAGLSSLSTFAQASSWASSLVVDGISGWRLPTDSVVCAGYNCTTSEMGHLFYTELGSTAPQHMNAGDLQFLTFTGYWSGTVDSARSGQAWAFSTIDGQQFSAANSNKYSALAVHSGDILAAVPEPETLAMLLAGLGLIGAIARRRKVQTT
ncbi:PEP-CTERM sorting domain-containing protein [Rhodoferax lacus]|uniref:PEP-CTERM sorting domain-containing protein n=1 Tax=Rhodoferax lacus TaxID=2184758 RepID=UPI001F2A2A4B|nr:PEP-CTERM sorting domain-containing protein [Rhodoferax lacus]